MTLSVIIVSYNVKYFLEQCLCSVRKAIETTDQLAGQCEIFVIDNNSTDNSFDYLQPKFPGVQFLSNKENTGFARANNKALLLAKGKYILFLNPDTVIAEDSLLICISFLESLDRAGAVGVRMVDGRGKFLKESKRGFPFPWTAFCKLSGLTSLFPHSKLFSSYYLGHLDEYENNPIDVLSGAFLLAKKQALDKTGGFDEQFFMYAEDIDLSYRMQKAGYINYYIADTSIIHFKGESTSKNIRYVKLFYKAMDQFMHKHMSSSGIFLFLMKIAVWLRSKIAALTYLFRHENKRLEKANVFLTGDEECIVRLKRLSVPDKMSIVQNQTNANEIVFCEGNAFSFKKIIEHFQENDTSLSYKIHSSNSYSLVGSDSKNKNGDTIEL